MSSYVAISGVPEDVGFATFFKRLYELRANTDVDFALQGPDGPVTFSAHKMILSLWSPYFADLFYSGKKEKMDNIINIFQLRQNDGDGVIIKPEAFEAMLRFMYGCIPSLKDCKKARELYEVAIEFQISSLQKTCRQFLNELDVVPSNVFDILEASKYMENKSRTDVCLKLIQDKTKEVMETIDLSELSSSMLTFFLNLPKMSLTGEYDLLTWVFSWARKKCEENNQYSNVREVLEPFLPKLHFLALTVTEFTTLLIEWPNFFTKDEIVTIYMNMGVRGSKKMPEWFDENAPSRIYNESKLEKNEAPEVKKWKAIEIEKVEVLENEKSEDIEIDFVDESEKSET